MVSDSENRFSVDLFLCFAIFLMFSHMELIFPIDRLQFNQKSLLSPLPTILTNKSSQEMIMTHCLADTVAPDASEIACMSVY